MQITGTSLTRIFFAACLSLLASQSALSASFSYFESLSPSSAYLDGAASYSDGFGEHGGIHMPDGSNDSSFSVGFTVPPEHPSGSRIRVGIWWHTNSTNTPCSISLRPNAVSIAQPGREHAQGAGASSGFEAQNGQTTLQADEAGVTKVKIYTIEAPEGEESIQPFNTINFGLFRRPDGAGDTCDGSLTVQGIAAGAISQ